MTKKKKTQGQIVNKASLAKTFGVHLSTVDAWIRKGVPVLQKGSRGKVWKFDTAAVFVWHTERTKEQAAPAPDTPLEAAKLRERLAKAEIAEIEAAERRGEIALVEDVAEAVGQVFDRVRTKLLALPNKMARKVILVKTLPEAKNVLEAYVYEVLAELADHGEPPYRPETPGMEAGPGTNL